jgi:hypothetical protein
MIGAGPAILQFSRIFEAQIKKLAGNLGWKIGGKIAESQARHRYSNLAFDLRKVFANEILCRACFLPRFTALSAYCSRFARLLT